MPPPIHHHNYHHHHHHHHHHCTITIWSLSPSMPPPSQLSPSSPPYHYYLIIITINATTNPPSQLPPSSSLHHYYLIIITTIISPTITTIIILTIQIYFSQVGEFTQSSLQKRNKTILNNPWQELQHSWQCFNFSAQCQITQNMKMNAPHYIASQTMKLYNYLYKN